MSKTGILSALTADQLERFLDFIYVASGGEKVHISDDPVLLITFEITSFVISVQVETGRSMVLGQYNSKAGVISWYDVGPWVELTDKFVLDTLEERERFINSLILRIEKLKDN